MVKLIVLILGLAIGFGGGVWWGHKNPEAAAKLSAEEERRVIEASIALNKKMQATLDKLQNKTPAPGSGFVGSSWLSFQNKRLPRWIAGVISP